MRGGKRRGEEAREGVHNLRKMTPPPSSDGWLQACVLKIFRGARPTSGGLYLESPPPSPVAPPLEDTTNHDRAIATGR